MRDFSIRFHTDLVLFTMYLCWTYFICMFSGICPLSGMILYEGNVHRGTFCDDGTYPLSQGQSLILGKNMLNFVLYSTGTNMSRLYFDVELSAASMRGILNPCQTFRQSKQLGLYHIVDLQMYSNDQSMNNIEIHVNFRLAPRISISWNANYKHVASCSISVFIMCA